MQAGFSNQGRHKQLEIGVDMAEKGAATAPIVSFAKVSRTAAGALL